MALILEVVSEHKHRLKDRSEYSFGPEGGTIGRSLRNDWVLADTERFISGRHATIDYRGGSWFLADVSSNGVYVNHSLKPLGHGNPRRLFDGDHLRMGNFEMLVRLDEGEDLDVPPDTRTSLARDQVAALDSAYEFNPGEMLLDEAEITGENVFLDSFFVDRSDEPPGAKDESAVSQHPAPALDSKDDRQTDVSPENAGEPAESQADTDLLDVFLEAAGVDPNDIHPSVDPGEIMANAGRVMAELVRGISELLVVRANMKSMFRLDQTTVLPRHNNPLKLSEGTSDALRQLLVGREGEYLGPLDSVRDACKDLHRHHDAVVAAMIRSFNTFVERLDPERLEEEFGQAQETKALFGALGKRKYWDLYRDLYAVITETDNGPLPTQFFEDFVRQYEKQLNDYKRVERALSDTQKLRGSRGNGGNGRESATRKMKQAREPGGRSESATQRFDVTEAIGDAGSKSDPA